MEEETTESQVGKLVEAIQQASSKSSRTGTASSVEHSAGSARSEGRNCQECSERIKALALECKKLSN
jgi:hypothetical protein